MKPVCLVACLLCLGAVACSQNCCEDEACVDSAFPELRGPYLGQTPPGLEPEIFAPGIVSTGLATRDIAMTPDGEELYFAVTLGSRTMIMESHQENGTWTEPAVAPFSGRYLDIATGSKKYFRSDAKASISDRLTCRLTLRLGWTVK